MRTLFLTLIAFVFLCSGIIAQTPPGSGDDKAAAVLAKSVQMLGGDRYLHVASQVGRGSFSSLKQGGVASYQSFSDAIVFPDKERTDFKGSSRSTQVNTGDSGWIWDGDQELVK